MLELHESRAPGLSCQIVWSGQTELDQDWSFDLHDVTWRIYRNRTAGAGIVTPSGYFPLEPGVVVVVPPHNEFRSRCLTPGIAHAWLAVECPGITAEVIRRQTPMPCAVISEPWWHDALDRLPLQITSGPSIRLTLQALASLAIAQALGRGVAADLDHSLSMDASKIEPALSWIRAHNNHPLSQAALARKCGVSSSHFARLFRRVLGVSPIAWQRQERLRLAADLLLRSTYPIEEIAIRCGFANRYHFSRAFAATYHLGPSHFRRNGAEIPSHR